MCVYKKQRNRNTNENGAIVPAHHLSNSPTLQQTFELHSTIFIQFTRLLSTNLRIVFYKTWQCVHVNVVKRLVCVCVASWMIALYSPLC